MTYRELTTKSAVKGAENIVSRGGVTVYCRPDGCLQEIDQGGHVSDVIGVERAALTLRDASSGLHGACEATFSWLRINRRLSLFSSRIWTWWVSQSIIKKASWWSPLWSPARIAGIILRGAVPQGVGLCDEAQLVDSPRPQTPAHSQPKDGAGALCDWRRHRWPPTRGRIRTVFHSFLAGPRFWHSCIILRPVKLWLCSDSSHFGQSKMEAEISIRWSDSAGATGPANRRLY